jgi:hypothetical protein
MLSAARQMLETWLEVELGPECNTPIVWRNYRKLEAEGRI